MANAILNFHFDFLNTSLIRAQNVISNNHYQSSDGRQGEYICKRWLEEVKSMIDNGDDQKAENSVMINQVIDDK